MCVLTPGMQHDTTTVTMRAALRSARRAARPQNDAPSAEHCSDQVPAFTATDAASWPEPAPSIASVLPQLNPYLPSQNQLSTVMNHSTSHSNRWGWLSAALKSQTVYVHEGTKRHTSPPHAPSTSIWWSSKSHPRKAPAEPQDDGAQDNEGHVVGLEHALVDGLVKATRARADNLAADNRPGTAAHVQDTRPGKVIVTYTKYR